MALDEVIRQLIEVRAKMQEAQGLTGAAEDSLRDSASQARDALQGTGNPAALDGLGMYDQVENDLGEVLAALTEVDRNIARYIDFASPGHASGKQNTDIPRPTGEAIVSESQDKRSRLNRMADLTLKKPDDTKDAVSQSTYLGEQVVKNIFGDNSPGSAVTSTSVAADPPHQPPTSQSGDAASNLGLAAALLVEGAMMSIRTLKRRREDRRHDRD